ncbi:Uncharacterized conserved protein [Mycoplasmopsis californica]|uniref:DUF262 domain-containing HNH endonuclease family protein n=1 Tax=Mycoplasmopsis equigenitalium TaxID=114883 RepID=A0ABY5J1H7_9BACT|nr:DUF262 domain-containing protein [Mycoplasmopsis equigenitalium]UUD37112.1 DUF262 domain-containing HNH endonuclease family protein [Mycoplasmopsis equigenitalium]VEU69584.1 Uncharacterized conserved protein [Mycoplasmopsis californica]
MIIKNESLSNEYIKIYSLKDEKISFPIFQRPYSWKIEQIEAIKEDLLKGIENKDCDFYLLDFICYKNNDKLMIADGQQRLVTINNLIKAIKDHINEKELKNISIEMFNLSYDIYEQNKKYKDHFINNVIKNPFKKIYLNFKSFLLNHEDKIREIIDIIKNRMYIYKKICKNADDAFSIFQQINSGGKPLQKDDILATALNHGAKKFDVKIENKIPKLTQKTLAYYKHKTQNITKTIGPIEMFAFLNQHVINNEDDFKNFNTIISNLKEIDNDPITTVIKDMNRPAILDVLYALHIKNKLPLKYDHPFFQKIIFPLMMVSIVFSFKKVNPSKFLQIIQEIIKEINTGTAAEKISKLLINKINNDEVTLKIDFDEFKNKLGDPKIKPQYKKALLLLGIIMKNNALKVDTKNINLEHIFPQNPNSDWIMIGGWPTDSEEKNKLIENIGNMFLLPEACNKRIKNEYVDQKKSAYEKAWKNDEVLKNTEINKINIDEFETEKEKYIYKRQEKIAHIIYDNFPFAQIMIKKDQ